MARKGTLQAEGQAAITTLSSGREQRTCPTCGGTYGPAPSDRMRHLNTKAHVAASAAAGNGTQAATAELATVTPITSATLRNGDTVVVESTGTVDSGATTVTSTTVVPDGYFLTSTGKVRKVRTDKPAPRAAVAKGADRYAAAREGVLTYLRASRNQQTGIDREVFEGQDPATFRDLLVRFGGESGADLAGTSDGNVRTHRRVVRRALEAEGLL